MDFSISHSTGRINNELMLAVRTNSVYLMVVIVIYINIIPCGEDDMSYKV